MNRSIPHPFFSRNWQAPATIALADAQRDWLEDAGSLTHRLQLLGDFRVQPLQENTTQLAADEADFLALDAGQTALLREVLLCVDDRPCVYARSLLPLSSLRGDNSVLADLHARPLGSELFRNPVAERRTLEVCWLPADQLPVPVTTRVLARRSLFLKNGQPLLVAEGFLPALWQRLHK